MANIDAFWPAVVRGDLAETRRVEYKAGVDWDRIEHKVYRAVLAMANTEEGGLLVVGVSENNGSWSADGITDENWSTYGDLQNLSHKLGTAGHPPVDLDVWERHDEGNRFLLITVRPSSSPIICDRSCPNKTQSHQRNIRQSDGVQPGVIYYRTLSKESKVADRVDWEEILSRHKERHFARGYEAKGKESGPQNVQPISNRTAFIEELGGF